MKQCAILHSTPIARKWTPGHIFTHISRKTRTRTHTHKNTITPTREYNSKGLRRDPFVKLRVRRVDPAISAITIRPKLDDKKIVYAEVKNKRSLKWTENSAQRLVRHLRGASCCDGRPSATSCWSLSVVVNVVMRIKSAVLVFRVRNSEFRCICRFADLEISFWNILDVRAYLFFFMEISSFLLPFWETCIRQYVVLILCNLTLTQSSKIYFLIRPF